ncbi:MAG TPA: DNA translocase FtsK 4TM domain-containing protein, partial [Chitinophagaceae bacterium]|nr:DNA translocase FtsK 4TM domain-containing protein [Chitinophagaceae bacterium]
FLFTDDLKVANLLGRLGAWAAHMFIYNGFGLASFLICSFFFVLGMNLLFSRRIFSIRRNLRYVLAGLLFFSVAFSFISPSNVFPWGGAVGDLINNWLQRFLGWVGTAVLLSVAGLAYFIWRFNPIFNFPARRSKVIPSTLPGEDNSLARTGELENENDIEPQRNYLKSEGGIVVIPPQADQKKNQVGEFKVVEKNPTLNDAMVPSPLSQEIVGKNETPLIVPGKISKSQNDIPDLELEINPPRDEMEEDEVAVGIVKMEDLQPYEPTLDLKDYKYPSLDLLENIGSERIVQDPAELETNKNQIINTLKNYDIAIQKISATVGPTVTLYEIVPAAGIRISRIKNLEDDIALSLAALGIRIIAPIPGKGTIGIEVPNVKKTVVSMRTLLASEKFQHNHLNLPIALGKKIDNENFIVDLTAMPHLLMAGATGQGKSVGINAILVSLLYKKHPSQLKLVLVDPKKVELSIYRTIERHFLAKLPGEEEAIITDTRKVIHTLNALCIEMDNRYDLLKEAGARNIKEYNEKFVKRKLSPQKGHQFLPFIVLVIDEFADLIMTAGKEVEMPIARLAQLARAVGIHLIIATQRPSVNIITGTIKANFPARIAFKVSSKVDSRTILDLGGAEQLIGKGDMLISYNGELTRLQCAFVDTPEVEEVTEFIGDQRGYPQAFMLPEYVDEKELEGKEFDLTNRDPLFEDAARLIVQNQVGSTSLLQRRMKLGYNRAGRLMDQLEAAGIVGPNQGSKARDVLIKSEMDLQEHLSMMG